MKLIVDQIGRKLEVKTYSRIISLVPSITELLFDLGLKDQVAGRTKFCIHPKQNISGIPKVGGTKNINFEKILSLRPDLVIVNKEENDRAQVETLMENYPVFVTNVTDYDSALEMVQLIGVLTSTSKKSRSIQEEISRRFNDVSFEFRSCVYLIWKNPYMTIGGDTFIESMLTKAGFQNLFSHSQRYPSTTIEEIRALNPDVVLLSSEPYPFKEGHVQEIQMDFPDSKVMLVDGEIFSWYGSRMLGAPAYFKSIRG